MLQFKCHCSFCAAALIWAMPEIIMSMLAPRLTPLDAITGGGGGGGSGGCEDDEGKPPIGPS